jgi:hypothetical protein
MNWICRVTPEPPLGSALARITELPRTTAGCHSVEVLGREAAQRVRVEAHRGEAVSSEYEIAGGIHVVSLPPAELQKISLEQLGKEATCLVAPNDAQQKEVRPRQLRVAAQQHPLHFVPIRAGARRLARHSSRNHSFACASVIEPRKPSRSLELSSTLRIETSGLAAYQTTVRT